MDYLYDAGVTKSDFTFSIALFLFVTVQEFFETSN